MRVYQQQGGTRGGAMAITDILKLRAVSEWYELFKMFVSFLNTQFPDNAQCKDVTLLLTNMYDHSSEKQTEALGDWHSNLMTPLSKKIKYGKALERLTQRVGTVFDACEYHDMNALKLSSKSEMLESMDVFSLYETIHDDAIKDDFWHLLSAINKRCFDAMSKDVPVTPTRAAIQENIKAMKAKAPSAEASMSLSKSFVSIYANFCASVKLTDAPTHMTSAKWTEIVQGVYGDGDTMICDGCAKRDVAAFHALCGQITECPHGTTTPTEEVWGTLDRLNGLVGVERNIPHKMMTRIEDMASRIASDITSGKTSFENMNLAEIGSQVLSGVDERDMTKFASNIDSILPALQAFQQSSLSNL